MNKKQTAIVFGITKELTFALANVIMGIKKYSPTFADEIIIFHDGILSKDKEIISNILLCRFIEYEFPIKDKGKFDPFFFNQFSSMAYSRFECFNLLKEFKNVIWLDVDILIQKDISGLMDYSKTGFGILPGDLLKHNLIEPIEGFDMNKLGYWTGTIIFTDALKDYEKMTEWCYQKLEEYASKLYLPDQAIINILIMAFNIEVMEIDKDIYCAHPIAPNVKDAIIVHSYRPKKFWNCWKFKEWDENNKKWLKMNGTPYNGKRCNFFYRWIEKHYPGAPNPVRKPRNFVKFVIQMTFNNPYKNFNEINEQKRENLNG